jgi:uncharacterized peroxidase-related enzyme
MSTLPLVDPTTAEGRVADLLETVRRSLGVTPNMTRAMANSPALLHGYLEFGGALAQGRLRPSVREQIALAVAQANGCDYCLSAHTYLAEHATRLDAATIRAARNGDSDDPRTAAVLQLARAVNASRGSLHDGEIDAARSAGLSDEEIAETIGQVALNVFTNFFNKAAGVDIDFPHVAAA